jgi:hypothetical protein
MPKHEGTKGQLKGKTSSGATKMEGPEKEQPSTYKELGISYKDASQWQKMAEGMLIEEKGGTG